MTKEVRHKAIVDYVNSRETVSLTQLCAHFGISISTLRRDVAELCDQGAVKKMYGCISRNMPSAQLIPFHVRSSQDSAFKDQVAANAAQFVQENDSIFIDSGSTTCLLVEYLAHLQSVTIVTNNLDVVIRAIPHENLQVYILPGVLYRQNNSFSAFDVKDMLREYSISKAFIAASGVSIKEGVSHTTPAERALKRSVIDKATKNYLLIDHNKFDAIAPLHLCAIDAFDCIITDQRPPDAYLQYCQSRDIDLIY